MVHDSAGLSWCGLAPSCVCGHLWVTVKAADCLCLLAWALTPVWGQLGWLARGSHGLPNSCRLVRGCSMSEAKNKVMLMWPLEAQVWNGHYASFTAFSWPSTPQASLDPRDWEVDSGSWWRGPSKPLSKRRGPRKETPFATWSWSFMARSLSWVKGIYLN